MTIEVIANLRGSFLPVFRPDHKRHKEARKGTKILLGSFRLFVVFFVPFVIFLLGHLGEAVAEGVDD